MYIRISDRALTWCLLALFMIGLNSQAQEKSVRLANTRQFTLHSTAVNDDFEIMVGLPFGYAQSNTRYKVLYVLDANVTFGMVNDIQTLMSFEPEHPALIVVGIGYKDFGNWIQKRSRDYMPSTAGKAPGSGGTDKFLSFLENQLIPEVDKKFKTNGSNLIYGHSTAGLFGLYSLFTRPALFEGYIITSPSVDEDNGFSHNLFKSPSGSTEPARVFISYGNREKASFQSAYKSFLEVFKAWKGEKMTLQSQELDASHMSSMAPAFVKGLEFVIKDK
ncbi:MAG: alpha/beta hydrolase [Roseivirga sp.]|nr:alpha/beta hydrolase [Roseivirga sp.]